MRVIAEYLFVYTYLCAPRVILTIVDPGSELAATRGWLDRRLAYAALLLAGHYAVQWLHPKVSRRVFLTWLHLEFVFGSLEAGVLYFAGVGYSPLFFYHADRVALLIALAEHWRAIVGMLGTIVSVDLLFQRMFAAPPDRSRRLIQLSLALLALFAVRSGTILWRHAIPSEVTPWQFATSLREFAATRNRRFELALSAEDSRRLRSWFGIARPSSSPPERHVIRPRNLITVYVEGLQNNVANAHVGTQALMPNLTSFAARSVRFINFFNAVTPTINALVSSQCGSLTQVQNSVLESDRGLTRDLLCLSDRLHREGYVQVFLGGADSRFSGKRAFLKAHGFDEVWGAEDWARQPEFQKTARNDWGLQDTDLMRAAVERLDDLERRRPFDLTLLTVNTHSPGFLAPDCPDESAPSHLLAAFRCTDEALGILLAGLEQKGLADDTVVAIMGDHTIPPTPENATALGDLTLGWYGRVFMAIQYPGSAARIVDVPSFTPDLAAISMDALGFDSKDPLFIAGRSALLNDPQRVALIAPSFELMGTRMVPAKPSVSEQCPADAVLNTQMKLEDGVSACERARIVAASNYFAPAGP